MALNLPVATNPTFDLIGVYVDSNGDTRNKFRLRFEITGEGVTPGVRKAWIAAVRQALKEDPDNVDGPDLRAGTPDAGQRVFELDNDDAAIVGVLDEQAFSAETAATARRIVSRAADAATASIQGRLTHIEQALR
ncbi:hypothetical protein [Tsukamurella strandjordii]|uniref:Uncharacterized protein n=1 Tax=Tsukamurella strandjordii TaxID=147577 RepID=A0AA90NI16_9ACTN|nr:hypothetical protein [Tsukamurella strandjordii]MDP0398925.1 hypothetical protein [Tsukamurella strandjordii]